MQERTLDVHIPKGIRPGQHLRLAGQGGPGSGGARAGDLYLEIEFKPHPRYRIEGSDVYVDLPLAPGRPRSARPWTCRPPTAPLQLTVPPGLGRGPEAPPQGSRIARQEPGRPVCRAHRRPRPRPTARRRGLPTKTWRRRSPTSIRAFICKDDRAMHTHPAPAALHGSVVEEDLPAHDPSSSAAPVGRPEAQIELWVLEGVLAAERHEPRGHGASAAIRSRACSWRRA